ncbi:methionine sulfoxide reductase [Musa troglodytarum]|uniref:peptide-methionine (S)-S-oxide reductase n=1 Tax=Musa troglodytarum TaxID=320322 RepID=A0A9E7EQ38_9LILI|nr:methionine sulfoxide reductase [Musa troglodytarum]URD81146.1 methionine sulfoxide reductase [Musa troglodytarum]URD81147.1 methionine sulfoxide reductase [Musa troglodytarum]
MVPPFGSARRRVSVFTATQTDPNHPQSPTQKPPRVHRKTRRKHAVSSPLGDAHRPQTSLPSYVLLPYHATWPPDHHLTTMLVILNTAAAASPLLGLASHHFSKFPIKPLASSRNFKTLSFPSSSSPPSRLRRMSWLGKLGLGFGGRGSATEASSAIAQGPDDDVPAAGQEFAQFGAGCFWGVELGFQRVPGVTKTEVGYSQGNLHEPTYEDICTGTTNHSEVVRLQYDPRECKYEDLLDAFWERHDPTTLNRQGNDVGTQYRSGIYFYTPEQEKAARESLERRQKVLNRKIVTEILPAKKFYRAEEYHQQYLEKGGRFGFKQSAAKGCSDPIRCYG